MLRRFRNSDDGAALVEAAIVLPVAVLLCFAGVELAVGLMFHHQADKSVRAAARYMARLPTAEITDARAKNLVTGADSTATASVLGIPSSMLVNANVTVDPARLGSNFVRVQAAVTYKTLFGSFFLPANFTFTVRHEQPYVGE